VGFVDGAGFCELLVGDGAVEGDGFGDAEVDEPAEGGDVEVLVSSALKR